MTDSLDVDLDEMDIAILRRVEADYDVNLSDLADDLGMSKSAIHYRLQKLKDADVVESVSADVNPLALGLDHLLITEISVVHETGYAEDIGADLADVPGVEQVYYTMGDVDFVVLSRVQNRDQLNELVDAFVAIDGVNETSSRFVMGELSTGGRPTSGLSTEMEENVLNG